MNKNDSNAPRGTGLQPKNRFSRFLYEHCDEYNENESPRKTELISDNSKSVITHNESPDIGYEASLNPYRGCEHGCIYCYARPMHECFGYSCGLDFETKILVKHNAPELLKKEILAPGYKPTVLSLSSATDPYQPIEQQFQLTRKCLEVLAQYRHPVCIVTKNALILRDIDLLKELAKFKSISVSISITTLDPELKKILEPRTTPPETRISTIRKLSSEGIPVNVLVAPIIPALTDNEIPQILKEAANAGATEAYYSILRLPYGVAELFEDWLNRWFPLRKEKILHRIKSLHGGKIYDPQFFRRLTGEGACAEHIKRLFEILCRKYNLNNHSRDVCLSAFSPDRQMRFKF